MVRALLGAHASVSAVDQHGTTALDFALDAPADGKSARKRQLGIVKLLVEAGAPLGESASDGSLPDDQGKIAAIIGNQALVLHLLKTLARSELYKRAPAHAWLLGLLTKYAPLVRPEAGTDSSFADPESSSTDRKLSSARALLDAFVAFDTAESESEADVGMQYRWVVSSATSI